MKSTTMTTTTKLFIAVMVMVIMAISPYSPMMPPIVYGRNLQGMDMGIGMGGNEEIGMKEGTGGAGELGLPGIVHQVVISEGEKGQMDVGEVERLLDLEEFQGLKPRAAPLVDGGYVVVWISEDDKQVLGKLYDESGTELNDEALTLYEIVDDEVMLNHVSVAGLEDGNFAILWSIQDQEKLYDLVGLIYDPVEKTVIKDKWAISSSKIVNIETLLLEPILKGEETGFVVLVNGMLEDEIQQRRLRKLQEDEMEDIAVEEEEEIPVMEEEEEDAELIEEEEEEDLEMSVKGLNLYAWLLNLDGTLISDQILVNTKSIDVVEPSVVVLEKGLWAVSWLGVSKGDVDDENLMIEDGMRKRSLEEVLEEEEGEVLEEEEGEVLEEGNLHMYVAMFDMGGELIKEVPLITESLSIDDPKTLNLVLGETVNKELFGLFTLQKDGIIEGYDMGVYGIILDVDGSIVRDAFPLDTSLEKTALISDPKIILKGNTLITTWLEDKDSVLTLSIVSLSKKNKIVGDVIKKELLQFDGNDGIDNLSVLKLKDGEVVGIFTVDELM